LSFLLLYILWNQKQQILNTEKKTQVIFHFGSNKNDAKNIQESKKRQNILQNIHDVDVHGEYTYIYQPKFYNI